MKSLAVSLGLIALATVLFAKSSPSQDSVPVPVEDGPLLKLGAEYRFVYPPSEQSLRSRATCKILSAPRSGWVEVEYAQITSPPTPSFRSWINLKHVIRIDPNLRPAAVQDEKPSP